MDYHKKCTRTLLTQHCIILNYVLHRGDKFSVIIENICAYIIITSLYGKSSTTTNI